MLVLLRYRQFVGGCRVDLERLMAVYCGWLAVYSGCMYCDTLIVGSKVAFTANVDLEV